MSACPHRSDEILHRSSVILQYCHEGAELYQQEYFCSRRFGIDSLFGVNDTPHFPGSVRFYCFLDLGSLNRNISVEVHISLIHVNY